MIDIQALRFDEKPMKSCNLEPVLSGRVADAPAFGSGEIGYGISECERGNFDGVVAEFRRVGKDVFNGPVAKDLVTDSEM